MLLETYNYKWNIPHCQSPGRISRKILKGWGFHPPTPTQFLCQSCHFLLCNIKTKKPSFSQQNAWWGSLRKTTVCRTNRHKAWGKVGTQFHFVSFLLPTKFISFTAAKGLVQSREELESVGLSLKTCWFLLTKFWVSLTHQCLLDIYLPYYHSGTHHSTRSSVKYTQLRSCHEFRCRKRNARRSTPGSTWLSERNYLGTVCLLPKGW